MSPIVSRRRRRLPHNSARITPGMARTFSSSERPIGSRLVDSHAQPHLAEEG